MRQGGPALRPGHTRACRATLPPRGPRAHSSVTLHALTSTAGTDSRVGFGFRFGPHADAQVLLELGPQKRTEKLTRITTTTPGPDDFQFGVGKRHLDPLDPLDPLRGGDALPELEHNYVQGRSVSTTVTTSWRRWSL